MVDVLTEIAGEDGTDVMAPGVVGIEWLAGRRALGIDELDGAAIRLAVPREFTQLVSRLMFECREPDGGRQFAGIQYLSRLGDDLVHWAIYEPAASEKALTEQTSAGIEADDPDLAAAIERLGLTLSR